MQILDFSGIRTGIFGMEREYADHSPFLLFFKSINYFELNIFCCSHVFNRNNLELIFRYQLLMTGFELWISGGVTANPTEIQYMPLITLSFANPYCKL